MTSEEFLNLEIDERVEFSDGDDAPALGTVVGYTGVRIRFDDGVVVDYPFNAPWVAQSFKTTGVNV